MKIEPEQDDDAEDCDTIGTVTLPLEAQIKIGKRLQDLYNHLLVEPLPDKFKKLLDELAKSESQQ